MLVMKSSQEWCIIILGFYKEHGKSDSERKNLKKQHPFPAFLRINICN